MSKPFTHAKSSARKFGGVPEDYLEIHNFMDSSKSALGDSRHRMLLHNTWAIGPGGILERIFGVNITNSDGRLVSVRSIGEQHVLEDFGGRFIPTVQDYLRDMEPQSWMLDGKKGTPDSFKKIIQTDNKKN